MDQNTKKMSKRDKHRRKKAKDDIFKRITDLDGKKKYQECLDFINSLENEWLNILEVFCTKVLLLAHLQRYDDALALQRPPRFGDENSLPYALLHVYAYCHRKKKNFLKAYLLYQNVHDNKNADDYSHKNSGKWLNKLRPQVQSELDKIAQERANNFLGDEPSTVAASSAMAASSSAMVAQAPSSSAMVAQAPSSSAKATPSSAMAPQTAPSPPVAAPSLPVAAPSLPVAAPHQEMMEFSDDAGTISFEMTKLNENCCFGIMRIGNSSFPKSYIRIGQNSRSKISGELRNNPHLLRTEFSIYSPSLSSRVAIVELVRPIKEYFELKLGTFKSKAVQTREKWWEHITDVFRSIFRGVIYGMFAMYSLHEVCSDLQTSLYVTEEGEAKIFHTCPGKFSYTQVQNEIAELLLTMECIISLISPRQTLDLQSWVQELESSYKLPDDICHFLKSLRIRKIGYKLQPTWLIDHPIFWSINHRVSFIQCLEDAIRGRVIKDQIFSNLLPGSFEAENWKTRALSDKLLEAIFNYKGDAFYSKDKVRVISFIHGIFFHANDYDYDSVRETKLGLTLEQKERLVTKVFPSIYTTLYDAVCDYAKRDSSNSFLQALEKFPSCVSHH